MRVETDPAEINTLRRAYGRSTAMWSIAGRQDINDEWWIALSGRASIDFNLALCYADSAQPIAEALEGIKSGSAPSVLMLAGPALGHAQTLTDSGWVCIGQTAFMRSPRLEPIPQPHGAISQSDASGLVLVRHDSQLLAARALLTAAYKISADEAATALPGELLDATAARLWMTHDSDGELLACVCTVDIDDLAVIWSMAIHPKRQGAGQGRALLAALHDQFSAIGGTRHFLLTSSNAGYGLYRGARYDILERWQMWSRPRWVIGTR